MNVEPLNDEELIAGRFALGERLGRGGMGEVWAARNLHTDARVAVKLVSERNHRPETRQRFLAEARAANAVRHPNLVRVHDAFELDDGRLALVMELLEGQTLADVITEEAPVDVATCAQWLIPVLEGVGALHAVGIVHRDLKPHNIFMARVGDEVVPKVLDFGLAKLVGEQGITETGATLGTPCYMAPEQAYGEKSLDHRADVFSLGAVMYECLSGIRPIEADGLGAYIKRLMTTAIMPLSEIAPDTPAGLAAITMAMLARDAERRPTLEVVIAHLREPDASERAAHTAWDPPQTAETPTSEALPLHGSPWRWWVAAGAASLVGVGVWAAPRSTTAPTAPPTASARADLPPPSVAPAPVSTSTASASPPRPAKVVTPPARPVATPRPHVARPAPAPPAVKPTPPAPDGLGLETDYGKTR